MDKVMSIRKLFDLGFIDDGSIIFVRDGDFHLLDLVTLPGVLSSVYFDCVVSSFSWDDDNVFYVDVILEEDL